MRPEPTRETERRARWAVTGGFALLTILFTGAFPPFANPNELSRLETVYAIVEEGTFRIDGAMKVLGDHEDKAVSGGHFYSNKAPGLAFAAVPVYRLLRCVFPAPQNATGGALIFLLRLSTVSFVAVFAVARLLRRLPPRTGPLIAGALALGTPLLFYARSFLSHAWSGALLFLAWDLLRVAEERTGRPRTGLLVLLAGVLSGWAVISEYTVLPIAGFFLLRAGARGTRSRMALAAAGAAVPAALLLGYQAACFGSPWTPSYAKEAFPAYAELATRPLFGFSWPSPSVLFAYLAHPSRGILVFSPFLAWAAAGFVAWWKSRGDRADFLFVFGSTVSFLLLMSSYPNWHGGWSLGSRYLVPVFFLLVLAAARALETPVSRGLFAAASVFSVLNHLVLTLTWPHFPTNVPWPAATASQWFLQRGWVAPGLWPDSALGKAAAVLVALGVAVAGMALAIRAAGPLWPGSLAAALIGLAPMALLLALSPELSYGGRLWRAAVFGKYSGLDPRREELIRVGATAVTPSEKRRAEDAWRLFGPEK